MSRKFSIFSMMMLNEVLKEIDEYIMLTGEMNPYIFMSTDTARVIREALNPTVTSSYKGSDATLCGYKVFINDGLKYGIVEIR